MNTDEELMAEALQYVLGEQPKGLAPKDEELFKLLCSAGVAKMGKEYSSHSVILSTPATTSKSSLSRHILQIAWPMAPQHPCIRILYIVNVLSSYLIYASMADRSY